MPSEGVRDGKNKQEGKHWRHLESCNDTLVNCIDTCWRNCNWTFKSLWPVKEYNETLDNSNR